MANLIEGIFTHRTLTTQLDFVRLSREGISMQTLNTMLTMLSVSMKELANMLPVSERQLNRYPATHKLRKDLSSHLLQLVTLFQRGYDVFGKEKFDRWIRTEVQSLSNQRPIDLLDTPIGIQMVEDLIGQIEYGIYS